MKNKTQPVRIAVVGCGRIARSHLQAISVCAQTCRFSAAVDRDRSRAGTYAREYGGEHVFTDITTAAASGTFDAAILCLPHDQLAPAAKVMLAQGRHVLLEKPCGTNAAEYREALETARQKGALLVPAYVRRFCADEEAIHAIIRSGELGDLQTLTFVRTYRKARIATPWWSSSRKAGGFWVPIFGSHDLDEMLSLAGEPPASVYAAYSRHLPELVEGETDGVLVMRFRDGLLGTLVFSCGADRDLPFGGRLVTGSRGCLHYGGDRLLVNGEERAVAPRDNMFTRQLLHFLKALEQGAPERVHAMDGYHVLQIIDAARRGDGVNRPVDLTAGE